MCGLSGYLSASNYLNESEQMHILKNMTDVLHHRGPDDSGYWIDNQEGFALGHRRLAIVDLTESGHQPMFSSDHSYVIAFNGEIYNHHQLRKNLSEEFPNISWRGTSDTETLLNCIQQWGVEKAINEAEGMFAFALWCMSSKELILARDRFGEKPLYYGWQGSGKQKTFIFSSELKSFKENPSFVKKISRNALNLFMRYNCVPSPFSIYEGVYKLDPGNLLKISRRHPEPKIKPYWSFEDSLFHDNSHGGLDETSTIEILESMLKKVVSDQMISDVPLGAFLSGGVDSSAIVSLMQSQSMQKIKTFSIGFNEKEKNEAIYAKEIAKYLGTDHDELYVTPGMCLEVIPNLSSIYDEPFSDSSQIPTFIVSKLARSKVTVALSGDGGDEIFGGYNRYLIGANTWPYLEKIPLPIRNLISNMLIQVPPEKWNNIIKLLGLNSHLLNTGEKIHKAADALGSNSYKSLYSNLTSHWKDPDSIIINNEEPDKYLKKQFKGFENLSAAEMMMATDAMTYLPNDILTKVDRAAMSVSLETRIPFLNHKLVEFTNSLPLDYKVRGKTSKWILRKLLERHVPNELINRPKAGFAIPLDKWLRGDLRDWGEDLLNRNRLRDDGFFNVEEVQKKWKEHQEGKRNWQYQLWDILVFQSWFRE